MRPSEHSIKPSQRGASRRLSGGYGSPGGNGAGRMRIVVGVVAILVLVAIPMYLWRRPGADAALDEVSLAHAAAASASRPALDPAKSLLAAALDGGVETEKLSLGRVWIESCFRGESRTPGERCDRQPYFEEALVKAVLENTECTPKTDKEASISYALRIDYGQQTIHVFAGKSGTLRKNEAKQSIECIQRVMPQATWDTLPHEYSRYIIAVLATYPAPRTPSP